tara:strand:+ start:794 stop:1240 length:447 start_codon:yes stop_codon:yes gene_type:complete
MTNRLCNQFLGYWTLDRHIDDFLFGQTGQFTGQATLVASDTEWHYFESGILTLQNQTPLKSEQRYMWSPTPNGFDIHFENGRFFHSFDLPENSRINSSATAYHWCDPDDYNVQYNLHNFPDWSSIWQVEGPKKSYKLESKYRRLSEDK